MKQQQSDLLNELNQKELLLESKVYELNLANVSIKNLILFSHNFNFYLKLTKKALAKKKNLNN